MAPGSILHHISFQSILLCNFIFNLYHKNTKNIYLIIIISIISHLCKWPWRDWQPLYRVGCKCLIVCVQVLVICAFFSYWINTLILNRGKYLSLLCCITLSSIRKKSTQTQELAVGFVVCLWVIAGLSIYVLSSVFVRRKWWRSTGLAQQLASLYV